MSAVEYYYSLEEKKGFIDWTKDGLEFLLKEENKKNLTSSQLEIVQNRLDEYKRD